MPTDEVTDLDDRLDSLVAAHPPPATDAVTFLGAQFDARPGVGPLPGGHGGLGLSPSCRATSTPASAARGARRCPVRAQPHRLRHVRADGRDHGSEDQRAVPASAVHRTRRSGASCSASPARAPTSPASSTRAVRDGDEWVVNGQKVWTTLAHMARFGMLLARTEPGRAEAQGHDDTSSLDMHAPGVDVRPSCKHR